MVSDDYKLRVISDSSKEWAMMSAGGSALVQGSRRQSLYLLDSCLYWVCLPGVRRERDVDKPTPPQAWGNEDVDLFEPKETRRRGDGANRGVYSSDCGRRPHQRAEAADASAESDQEYYVTIGPKINFLRDR